MLLTSIFFNINKNDIIDMKIGDTMLDQVINNFYFGRLMYIVLIVLFAFSFINDLKRKDKIGIKKYLNIKNFNICILFKYLYPYHL